MCKKIKTDLPDCYLRFAEEEDVPLILDFIRRLAEYENMSDQVVATGEQLQKNLFGEQRYAEVLLAYYHDQPVGFALFFHNFSTFMGKPGIHLEDLYVMADFRGKGIGTTLLGYLAQLAIDRNCARLEWVVLDWNTHAIEFYHALDAHPMDEWTTFRLTGESLKKVANNNYTRRD
ncbi:Acetyltransferase (GNAT) family protein [Fodinibius roseus]|uniref:Acetyltransferase (GNAT) family protein n=1 Tax=Fodinibius roseus TaxID=1194090 RepID=A0A1M5CB89_9BACT|nr:GNAT family N-acetyltransferase [Fodinibius roseus]SHF51857.1 Acetyltransferase (GNAT) family protein [Fodinibius roseus]